MTSDKYLDISLIVKDSGIHGKGLFSTIDILEGSKIFVIRGEAISEEECVKRETEGNVYIFWNEDSYIDTSMTDKIKYINHNCDCNCDILENDEESLLLTAYRDIKAGEELTIDYGYEEIYELCKCSICA